MNIIYLYYISMHKMESPFISFLNQAIQTLYMQIELRSCIEICRRPIAPLHNYVNFRHYHTLNMQIAHNYHNATVSICINIYIVITQSHPQIRPRGENIFTSYFDQRSAYTRVEQYAVRTGALSSLHIWTEKRQRVTIF